LRPLSISHRYVWEKWTRLASWRSDRPRARRRCRSNWQNRASTALTALTGGVIRLAGSLGGYGLAGAALGQGGAAEHEQHAGDHLHRDGFADDQRAEDHRDDRQQVGGGGGDGWPFVADEPVVEHVGDTGTQHAEDQQRGERVNAPVWRGQAA